MTGPNGAANNFWEAASVLERNGTPFVVVTLVGTRGQAPQDPGAKIIVTKEGLHFGTVGGGKVEAKCIVDGIRRLDLPIGELPTEVLTWNLQRDVGMTCGGEVTFLFERREASAWRIVVFGAGHVAQAVAKILETLQCRAIFVDNRPEWIEKLPAGVIRAPVQNFEDYVPHLDGSEFCVVTTRGHATDLPVLKALFARGMQGRAFPYIGGIGSDVKGLKLRKELAEFGASAEAVRNFRCPVGLPLGSNDPAEIAISICAELIQERDRLRAVLPGAPTEASESDASTFPTS